ncbi:MAG TPA: cupin domain-containing protein [Clostridiales bacterium]|nr:cupin domain-containing protein [Clostridiales bacterium]
MVIDFNKIEEVCNPKFKGGEKEYYVRSYADEHNKIMKGRLEPGASIGFHTHTDDCEVIYVIEGKGKMLWDEGEDEVTAGKCYYCPKGQGHSLINDSEGDLIFFAVVAKV